MALLCQFIFSIFWAPIAALRDYLYLKYTDTDEKAARTRLVYPRLIAAALGLVLFIIFTTLAALNESVFAGVSGGFVAASIILFGGAFIRGVLEAIGQYLVKRQRMGVHADIMAEVSRPQAVWRQALYGDSHQGLSSEQLHCMERIDAGLSPQEPEPDADIVALRESERDIDFIDDDPSAAQNLRPVVPRMDRFRHFLYSTSAPKIGFAWSKEDLSWLKENMGIPLLLMGVAAAMGFGLFAVSSLAIPGQFLMTGWLATPLAPYLLLAVGVAVISQFMIRFATTSASNTPAGEALEAVVKAEEILEKLKGVAFQSNPLADLMQTNLPAVVQASKPLALGEISALLGYIEKIKVLLGDEEWKLGVSSYAGTIRKNVAAPVSIRGTKKHAGQSAHRFARESKADGQFPVASLVGEGKGIDAMQKDFEILDKVPPDAQTAERWLSQPANFRSIENVFKRLIKSKKPLKVDPDYRPSLSADVRRDLIFSSWLLLVISVGILFFIFTGFIPFASAAWALPLAVVSGFASWVAAKRVLSRSSAGPYGEWAAIMGVAVTIFTTFTVLAGFGIGVTAKSIALPAAAAVRPLLLLMGVLIPLMVVLVYLARQYANKSVKARIKERNAWSYKGAQIALNIFKILLIFGFSSLAFVTVAALFNLRGGGLISSLGGLNRLMTFANSVITQALGANGLAVGTAWFAVFSILTFALSMVGVVLLTKSLLQRSPTRVKDFQHPDWKAKLKTFLGQSLKLAFTLGIIGALWIFTGFLPGARESLFKPFVTIAVLYPLLSGNAKFNYLWPRGLSGLNTAYNKLFGVAPTESKGWLIARELIIGFLVVIAPLIATGFSFSPASIIYLVGGGVTMLIRAPKLVSNVTALRPPVSELKLSSVESPRSQSGMDVPTSAGDSKREEPPEENPLLTLVGGDDSLVRRILSAGDGGVRRADPTVPSAAVVGHEVSSFAHRLIDSSGAERKRSQPQALASAIPDSSPVSASPSSWSPQFFAERGTMATLRQERADLKQKRGQKEKKKNKRTLGTGGAATHQKSGSKARS